MMKEQVQIALDNYAYGVRQLIPQYLTGKMKALESLEDELALILYSRDVIESNIPQLREEDPETLRLVDEYDRLFLLAREPLLAIAPYLATFREGKDISRTHWWYYLDQITRVQVEEFVLPAADRADEAIVLPEQIIVRQFAWAKG